MRSRSSPIPCARVSRRRTRYRNKAHTKAGVTHPESSDMQAIVHQVALRGGAGWNTAVSRGRRCTSSSSRYLKGWFSPARQSLPGALRGRGFGGSSPPGTAPSAAPDAAAGTTSGQGSRGWLRLHEKGGKRHDVPGAPLGRGYHSRTESLQSGVGWARHVDRHAVRHWAARRIQYPRQRGTGGSPSPSRVRSAWQPAR